MKPVNLLPEQHRRSGSAADGRGAYIVLGVLAALVAMVAVYALTANQVNSRKSDANQAQQEAAQLGARASSLSSFGDFAHVAQNRSASVRSLAAVRFDWERLMRELSFVMPRGSWFTQVNSSVTGDLSSGGSSSSGSTSSSSSSGAAAGSAPTGQPAADLVGCSPAQSEVAKLMVRLRRLYRVTDVTLNDSSRESDESGAASIDSCGRYLKFDLTLTFGDTPATGEAPTGGHSVPARLGGGS